MIKDKSYNALIQSDAVGLLKKAIDQRLVHIRDDCRFELNTTGMSHKTPWAYIKTDPRMRCYIWHNIYFNCCGFIPSYCQSCWKIVIRPANIHEAFKLYDIMADLDLNSKVGWEGRKTVFGNFGAYFYSRSLEEAKKKYETVIPAIRDIQLLKHPKTGLDIEPLIKRGCTEFEQACGPSDKWVMSSQDNAKEILLDSVFVQDTVLHNQREWLTSSVFRLWIHNAYAAGDNTVLTYTDGEMLFPPYVTYHGEKNG